MILYAYNYGGGGGAEKRGTATTYDGDCNVIAVSEVKSGRDSPIGRGRSRREDESRRILFFYFNIVFIRRANLCLRTITGNLCMCNGKCARCVLRLCARANCYYIIILLLLSRNGKWSRKFNVAIPSCSRLPDGSTAKTRTGSSFIAQRKRTVSPQSAVRSSIIARIVWIDTRYVAERNVTDAVVQKQHLRKHVGRARSGTGWIRRWRVETDAVKTCVTCKKSNSVLSDKTFRNRTTVVYEKKKKNRTRISYKTTRNFIVVLALALQ